MEFCDKSLKSVIASKAEAFDRKDDQPMSSLEFFVSLHLLKDVTECLDYMHRPIKRHFDVLISDAYDGEPDYNRLISDPRTSHLTSQIHRDIKPDNILVSLRGYNNRFIKLCDFGMSKVSEGYESDYTGTKEYMAPEVIEGKYNLKADIYSLGIIARELMDFDG